MNIALLTTALATATGTYTLKDITLDEAKELLKSNTIDSYIRHESTLNILTALLGTEIPAGTGQFTQTAWTSALVFKLNGRAPEGAVLTRDEIEDMGYKFQVLTKVAD
jgi:hypothetical protein